MKISITSEKRFGKFICLALIYLFVVNMSNGLELMTGISVSTISFALKAVIGLYFITLIPAFVRRITNNMIIIVIVSFMVALFNYLLFPSLREFFGSTMMDFFTMCLPIALSAMAIVDIKYFKTCLLVTARIMALMSFILLFGVLTQGISFYAGSYSMGLGYAILIPILILIYQLIVDKHKNWIDVVCLGTLLIFLLLYGSRGPLLAILLFVLFYMSRNFVHKKKYLVVLLICLCAVLFFASYTFFIVAIGDVLQNIGFSSRSIYMISSYGNALENVLSGRDVLWKGLLAEIAENPLAIRGINAEWLSVGSYAHNIALELVFQFGILIGGALLLLLVYILFKQLLSRSITLENEIVIIFAFSTFPALMFSNSLWISSSFWMWVGLSAGSWSLLKKKGRDEVINENSFH